MVGCLLLCLQAQEGNTYFTELAERVEYDNYGDLDEVARVEVHWAGGGALESNTSNSHSNTNTATNTTTNNHTTTTTTTNNNTDNTNRSNNTYIHIYIYIYILYSIILINISQ